METPYFLIHRDSMEENLSSFRQALEEEWGEGRIAYSVKTNACAYVLSFMKAQGVLAEVVSDDEYMLAGDLGFSPQEIVFNGPIKGKALFLQAVIEGAFVHIDSRRELSWLEELPEGQVYPVGLRVNLDLSPLCPEDVGLEKEGRDSSPSLRIFTESNSLLPLFWGRHKAVLRPHTNGADVFIRQSENLLTFWNFFLKFSKKRLFLGIFCK